MKTQLSLSSAFVAMALASCAGFPTFDGRIADHSGREMVKACVGGHPPIGLGLGPDGSGSVGGL